MTSTQKQPMTSKVACFDRAPFKDTVLVNEKKVLIAPGTNGEIIHGQQMLSLPDPMTKSCRVDIRFTNPECRGCKWQSGIDRRDTQKTKDRISAEIVAAGMIPCEI